MIEQTFWRTTAFVTTLLLTGRNRPQPEQKGRLQTRLEPGTCVTLPTPEIFPVVNSQQLLTGSFNGKTQSLLVMLGAGDKKIILARLPLAGTCLFLVVYNEKGLHTE